MAPPPDDDHECGWKVFAKDLVEKMAELEAKMAAMERRVLGPKSEKLPPMDGEVRKQRPADPAATQGKRRKNAELRATRVETDTVEHKVPEADRICPKCNGTKLRPVGVEVSTEGPRRPDGCSQQFSHRRPALRSRPESDGYPHWPKDRHPELAPKYWLVTRARLDPRERAAEFGPLAIPEPLPAPAEQPASD